MNEKFQEFISVMDFLLKEDFTRNRDFDEANELVGYNYFAGRDEYEKSWDKLERMAEIF